MLKKADTTLSTGASRLESGVPNGDIGYGKVAASRRHLELTKHLALVVICAFASVTMLGATTTVADVSRVVDGDGTIHLPALARPESTLLSAKSRAALKAERDPPSQEDAAIAPCPSWEKAARADMPAIRACEAKAFYRTSAYRRLRQRFDVNIAPQTFGGVYTEVVVPAAGIAEANRNRVLINVHGGAFQIGSRTLSQLEAIPIAAVGKIKVISIDYRQAPEYTFPAASEDVAAVYKEVLKSYPAKNIGIYGCSAGGLLTAESIAWFLKQQLPLPGAVGMLCEGAAYWTEGDSAHLANDVSAQTIAKNPYFKNTDPDDPLAFPVRSPQLLGEFPPSLLISSVRDFALSSVVRTHSLLVAKNVDADLYVWEGLEHAFHLDPALPESREVYEVTIKFFDKHLAR